MPNVYSIKICAICGKAETSHWGRHWKNNHPGASIQELQPGDMPSEPFNQSWLKNIVPISLREKFMTPA
jgi:predicted alpha/beta hydrolase family esterase